jgi:TPR repeat protein
MEHLPALLSFALIACLSGCKSAATKSQIREAGLGNASAQYELGVLYYNGQGVMRNSAIAAKWYRVAAGQGHAEAQYKLGRMYEEGWEWIGSFYDHFSRTRSRQPEDYVEAVKWYRMAAEQGHAGAQYRLGAMYSNGYGVPKDGVETVTWYRMAADRGDADAKKEIEHYPYNKFEKILNDAARGNAEAQYELACIYSNGMGTRPRDISPDIDEALKWFRSALDQGNENAKQHADFMNHFEETYKKAKKGDAEAQHALGLIYYSGWGVFDSDIGMAKEWFALAAKQGYEASIISLDSIYRDEEKERHPKLRDHDREHRKHRQQPVFRPLESY